MIKKSKLEVREILMKHASQNTPDLWDKIEPQLKSKPESKIACCEKHSRKATYRYAVAGFAVLLIGAVAIAFVRTPKNIVSTPSSVAPFSSANARANSPVNSSASSFSSSVLFSSLRFPNSQNVLNVSGNAGETADIAAFSEKNVIANSEIICKATVVNSYIKEYKYDTYCDKFEPNGRLHHTAKSIVYEIKIDDLYYNKKDVKVGDTIKVENYMSWEDPAVILQQKRQYILNLHDCGDTILYDTSDYASGNIKRDGRYAICYPFAPQIEVTLDQQYLFHDGWKSLINNKTIDVVFDKGVSFQQQDTFYLDKMKLRQDKDFISDYKKMIAKYK